MLINSDNSSWSAKALKSGEGPENIEATGVLDAFTTDGSGNAAVSAWMACNGKGGGPPQLDVGWGVTGESGGTEPWP